MNFVKFMASISGRITRIIAGVALIYFGYFVLNNVGGYILAVVGLVPLLAGLFDYCVFAPLFGAPISGKSIRKL
ncbi:MAG: DUF2892 domain-containing protein [Microcoleus sp.]